jgi:hypothetical protein
MKNLEPALQKRFRQCKRNLNKIKLPSLKLPALKPNASLLLHGILNGITIAQTNKNTLLNQKTRNETQENKPLSAGRGGKAACSNMSSLGRIAESAVKRTRTKKEHKPYKPAPVMHTFYSLDDMRRMSVR